MPGSGPAASQGNPFPGPWARPHGIRSKRVQHRHGSHSDIIGINKNLRRGALRVARFLLTPTPPLCSWPLSGASGGLLRLSLLLDHHRRSSNNSPSPLPHMNDTIHDPALEPAIPSIIPTSHQEKPQKATQRRAVQHPLVIENTMQRCTFLDHLRRISHLVRFHLVTSNGPQ